MPQLHTIFVFRLVSVSSSRCNSQLTPDWFDIPDVLPASAIPYPPYAAWAFFGANFRGASTSTFRILSFTIYVLYPGLTRMRLWHLR